MKKIIGVAVVAALMLSILALPAAANPAQPDTGVVNGTATLGKNRDTACGNDGGGAVSGPGLGFPGFGDNLKTAYYRLLAIGGVTSALHGTGDLDVCGGVRPVQGTVGAYCGASEGHDGKGYLNFNGVQGKLDKVGWRASAGGMLVVDGLAGENKKNTTPFVALLNATGGAACATKSGGQNNKSGGATSFIVNGTYTVG